jgi:hypothetical protein
MHTGVALPGRRQRPRRIHDVIYKEGEKGMSGSDMASVIVVGMVTVIMIIVGIIVDSDNRKK